MKQRPSPRRGFFPETVYYPPKPAKHWRGLSAPLAPEPLGQAARWRAQAEVLGLSKDARLRVEWMVFYETVAGRNAAATARYFGTSRESFYRWYRRFGGGNVRALEDQPSVPKTARSWQPDPLILERMLALRRKHPQWGKETLAAVYAAYYEERVTAHQFGRMIERFSMQRKPRPRARRPVPPKPRISYAVRRGAKQLWQLDTVALGRKSYVVTGVEHATKLGYAVAYERASSKNARDFLWRLRYVFGGPVRLVLTDNGTEFAGLFEKACSSGRVRRYYSRPRRPTDNPEVERFNQTLRREWEAPLDGEAARLNESLVEWLVTYNSIRPHHSLGLRTPLAVARESGLVSRESPAATKARLRLALGNGDGPGWPPYRRTTAGSLRASGLDVQRNA